MIRTHDIHKLSDFRQKASEHLARLKETGRAEVLTVNGEAAGVVMSPQTYDKLMEEVEMARNLEMIDRGMADVRAGRTRPAREALQEMVEKLGGKLSE
jgi:prevent-host-death family protein